MTNTPTETRAPRAFGWSSVIIIVGTIVIAAIMLLMIQVPTFQETTPLVVLGSQCFDPLSTRIIVAGVALLILMIIDAIDSRIITSRKR